MKYIDMHTHTTASDGTLTPVQLVDYAVYKGLDAIAVTDHDTVEGLEEAMCCADRYGSFFVLPGIEFSTEYSNDEIHILGYSINFKCKNLLKVLNEIKNSRVNRASKIIHKLQAMGFEIAFDEIKSFAQEGVIGRAHIARLLVEKGYVKSLHEVFQKYIGSDAPAYVPRYKLTPREAVKLIKNAGGYAVLAHPGLIKNDTVLEKILYEPFDGIEAYYPEHEKKDIEKFLMIAGKKKLMVTGGSDFHCPPSQFQHRGDLGSVKVPLTNIEKMLKQCL